MREPEEHVFENQITRNRYIWMALAICLPALAIAYFVPMLRNTLSLEYLSTRGWLITGVTSVVTLGIVQVIKNIFKI